MSYHYSITMKWSDEDQAYLVILPEFGPQPQTHGDTYEEAVTRAQQVLDLLVETYEAEGWPLPKARKRAGKKPTKKRASRRARQTA
jgi:predicted RNase H-like HicB family nuclease